MLTRSRCLACVAAASLLAMLSALPARPAAQEADRAAAVMPQYDAQGNLLLPATYREAARHATGIA